LPEIEQPHSEHAEVERVRLDRWLWAARFFKSRSQAKDAVDAGHVRVDGQRAKPSREIGAGVHITVPRGYDTIDVVVTDLTERRGSASDAARLYVETEDSVARREKAATSRRLAGAAYVAPAGRPNKRDRRALSRLKHGGPRA
jgi:ribosome-associated heat shock protein Hsp15